MQTETWSWPGTIPGAGGPRAKSNSTPLRSCRVVSSSPLVWEPPSPPRLRQDSQKSKVADFKCHLLGTPATWSPGFPRGCSLRKQPLGLCAGCVLSVGYLETLTMKNVLLKLPPPSHLLSSGEIIHLCSFHRRLTFSTFLAE